MKKKSKLIAVLLSAVICLSTAVFTVCAEEITEVPDTDTTTGDYVEETDPPYEEKTDPPYEEETDPPYEEKTDPPYEEETDPPYEEKTDPPYEEPDNTDGYYVGAGSDSDYTPGSDDDVASSNFDVYNTTNEIDTNTLTNSDWEEIKLALADAADSGSSGDDFSFIKNSEEGASNNGTWIIIIGILLVLMSFASLVFFIAQSKRASEIKSKGRRAAAQRQAAQRRTPDDYDDSYSNSPKNRNSSNGRYRNKH